MKKHEEVRNLLHYCGALSVVISSSGCITGNLFFALFRAVWHRRSKRRRDRHLSDDQQLSRIRTAHTASTMMTEYNPNYFSDTKYSIHDLYEVSRERLSFVR